MIIERDGGGKGQGGHERDPGPAPLRELQSHAAGLRARLL